MFFSKLTINCQVNGGTDKPKQVKDHSCTSGFYTLHCLLRSICPNSLTGYGTIIFARIIITILLDNCLVLLSTGDKIWRDYFWYYGHTTYQEFRSWVKSARNQSGTLRKHAYSNILKILPQKNENFQIKNSDNFQISAPNIDWYSLEPPRRGGSNEYPQSMFGAEIRKIMYTPVNVLLCKSGV